MSNQHSVFSSASGRAAAPIPALDTDSLDTDSFSPFPRRRLDAEEIRDTLLVLSGALDSTPGGAHPFPPAKEWDYTQHAAFTAVYDTNKRSVYLMQQRIKRHPLLSLFDSADPNTSTAERDSSITPIQALFMLNDKFVHEQAAGFAQRLLRERATEKERVTLAYQLAFGRSPRPEEIQEAIAYLAHFREKLEGTNAPAEKSDLKAWASYVRALLGSNEFIFVD